MMATSAISHIAEDQGLWRQRLDDAPPRPGRAALFLDRDGVIVEEINYLHRVEDMRLLPDAADIVRAANDLEIPAIMVTNQSGVGRGYYGWAEFESVQGALIARLAADGARLDMVLACAYHKDAQPPYDRPDHPWRKPRPGMLRAAADDLSLDLSRSWIIGDAASDIEAGRNAGLAGGLHVLTGHGERDRQAALAFADTGYEVLGEAGIGGAVQVLARIKSHNA